jgi:hypothetical protein
VIIGRRMESQHSEWTDGLSRKLMTNKQIDHLLRLQALESKNLYKKDLDTLTELRKQAKVVQSDAKKADLAAITLQNKVIQSDDLRRKLEKAELQRFLANQYEFQTSLGQKKKIAEQLQKIEEDKKNNNLVESVIMKDSIDKQRQRKELLNTELQMMQIREHEKAVKTQEIEEERRKERELLLKRTERDQDRDKKIKEFYQQREERQNYLQSLYSGVVSPKAKAKVENLSTWVEKNMERQLSALQAKEKQQRKEQMDALKAVWKCQIDENQQKKLQKKVEEQVIHSSLQRQIDDSIRTEHYRNIEKRAEQDRYRESLLNQAFSTEKRRTGSRFSPISPSFDGPKLRPPFAEVFKGRSSSVSVRDDVFPSASPEISRKVASPASELSVYSLHNPITNPIGELVPRPEKKPLFKPQTFVSM